MTHARTTSLGLTALLALPVLAACGAGSDGTDGTDGGAGGGTAVAITADDDRCKLEHSELEAGPATFTIRNVGSKTTEVYVYAPTDGAFTRVVTEVENIGPGTTRDLDVDLDAGKYEVACKPGQSGDGIRAPLVVTGEGGSPADSRDSEDSEAAYDREVELATDGARITGLEAGATRGEKIEFKLTNTAVGARTLEVKDPAGAVAGEVEDIEPGTTGELVVDLDEPGTWQVIIEGDGTEDIATALAVR